MTGGASVSLTFDDGPDPLWTPAVLAALERAGAQATFFLMTSQVERHPEVVARIRMAGHGIGLHCHEHRRHTTLHPSEIEHDTDTALGILAGHGIVPTLWRPPWGVRAPATAAIAADRGLKLVHWTADTEDWRGGHAGQLLARVIPELKAGTILLAHDGVGPGAQRRACGQTVAAIEPLVRQIRARGLECRPVPEAVAA
jgi:peptidoglycan/xylan/chitin deacetylase (PgdA/CDA1 family)